MNGTRFERDAPSGRLLPLRIRRNGGLSRLQRQAGFISVGLGWWNKNRPVAGGWNPADTAANLVLSSSNLTATGGTSSTGWLSARSLVSHASGLYYIEATVTGTGGNEIFGAGTSAATLASYCGSDNNGWCEQFTSQGNYYHGGNLLDTALPMGTRYAMCLDCTNGRGFLGAANTAGGAPLFKSGVNPVTGANPTFTFTAGTAMFVMGSISGSGPSITICDTLSSLLCTPPAGFGSWSGT